MVGIPAAYVMTDDRELLSDEKRVYSIIDGRKRDRRFPVFLRQGATALFGPFAGHAFASPTMHPLITLLF
jgi:hypothetical protein